MPDHLVPSPLHWPQADGKHNEQGYRKKDLAIIT
jgi:hypothetical protein